MLPAPDACATVEKDGIQYATIWSEYLVDDQRKTKLTVLRTERLLLPRSGIGYGVQEESYGVELASLPAWLEKRGYHVVPYPSQ